MNIEFISIIKDYYTSIYKCDEYYELSVYN